MPRIPNTTKVLLIATGIELAPESLEFFFDFRRLIQDVAKSKVFRVNLLLARVVSKPSLKLAVKYCIETALLAFKVLTVGHVRVKYILECIQSPLKMRIELVVFVVNENRHGRSSAPLIGSVLNLPDLVFRGVLLPLDPMLRGNLEVNVNDRQLITPCLRNIRSWMTTEGTLIRVVVANIRRILQSQFRRHNLHLDRAVFTQAVITRLMSEFMVLQTLGPHIIHIDINGRLLLRSAIALVVV
mmetsp:Transcript_1526/g.3341  ORF Transcript_1526/g.3341 Transcript_1526/m.3341 type:complete len:242 (+) Transcript_1526:1443-2168(+)